MRSIDEIAASSITPGRKDDDRRSSQAVPTQGASFADALSKAVERTSGNKPGGDPRHLPLPGSAPAADGFQERALGIRAYRQQLLASNIANADTPNYKAVDIDVQEAMKNARYTTGPSVKLATTSSLHISGQAPSTYQGVPIKYHVPSQAGADGNTVEMDVERSKFSENALMYEFSLDRVKGHFKDLMELLRNLK